MTNRVATNDLDETQKPHFVLVPLLAQGHIIPMVDMARLLADHGATVTVVTTPLNAGRIQPIIDRIQQSTCSIRFITLRFPCSEAGLPEGCENMDAIPSCELLINFLNACCMLRDPLVLHLLQQQLWPKPNCIISDAGHSWTREVAQELEIPRLTFNGFGCFSLLCRHIFHYDKELETITDENEPFVMPGLLHRVVVTKAHSPANFSGPGLDAFRKDMMDIEIAADGVVVNSFDELEVSYTECLQKARGKKVWTIGPMSLYNKNVVDMALRGNKASIDETRCLSWLNSMKPSSVLYASFGSLARTSSAQLIEIGLGLEASNHPFIWVIKASEKSSQVVEKWLAEGFEERTRRHGLIIRGWAPQLVILSHPAIGGFLTHCGWNSTLESISLGVPMITWPHFAEQFLNEKLIVEVLGVGIGVGVDAPIRWGTVDGHVQVTRDDVKKVVCRLMKGGEEVKEMRERIKELGVKAKRAMEIGGSSYENLRLLVQQFRNNEMRTYKKEEQSDLQNDMRSNI